MFPTRLARIAFASLCLVLCADASAARADGGFVFIRNAKNAATKVGHATLRDLLTGRAKKWPGGPPVQLVLANEESAAVTWLASTFFSTSGRTLMTKLRQEAFKGELRPPLAVSDDEGAIAKVKGSEGGIAVIKEGTPLPPGVALLEVEE